MKKPTEVIHPIGETKPKKPGGDLAFSIDEFCRRHSISHGTYYNLKEKDEGPREGHVMGRVLITKEAAKDWRKKISGG